MDVSPHGPAVRMTIFPNFEARTKREEELPISKLVERVTRANAPRKEGLPWLKLARFGDLRSKGDSLRHNPNVLAITGVEADYDGEVISFLQAVEILTQAALQAVVYTSPSHTEDTPRWRVLCPLSKEYPPHQRDAFLARLNGVFAGILAPESWVLSQSYYFGSVAKNPSHRAQLIEGTPVDLRPDLDATAIGNPRTKPAEASTRPTSNGAAHGPVSEKRYEAFRLKLLDTLRLQATEGQKHFALLRCATTLGGIQAAAGFPDETAVQWLLDALPDTVGDWRHATQTAKDGLARGRGQPIELPDRPHAGNGGPRPFGEADARDPPPTDEAEACDPPKPDAAEAKPQTKAKRKAATGLNGFDLTEDGIALAFAKEHQDHLRYDHSIGKWFQWTGKAWRQDETKLAFSWSRRTCRQLAKEAGAEDGQLATLAKAATAAAVERFAQSDPALAVTSTIWDRDTFLLGTPGGTFDLRSGELRDATREDYITKLTAVTPSETRNCPLWLAFLNQVTEGDAGLIRFLKQWCGYCLTGDTREHALLFAHGPGGNGKGVFLNIVRGIMGDYARNAAMDTFTASQSDRHPTDLAMLRGARLVTASETEEGRAWAEARIKALTGGDPITARFMRQDFFEFQPQFKLTIIGNHKPILRNVDEAARRRMNMAPFLYQPPNKDMELEGKLQKEAPAILRWMIDGCIDWQKNGLVRPDVVIEATAEYFSEQDTVHQWVEEACVMSPTQSETLAILFKSWSDYAVANGEKPGTTKWFNQTLARLGCESVKSTPGNRGKRGFKGIGIRPVATKDWTRSHATDD